MRKSKSLCKSDHVSKREREREQERRDSILITLLNTLYSLSMRIFKTAPLNSLSPRNYSYQNTIFVLLAALITK